MEIGELVKTRQDKTRQDKTRQDKTRQDKTRQDETVLLFAALTSSLVAVFGIANVLYIQKLVSETQKAEVSLALSYDAALRETLHLPPKNPAVEPAVSHPDAAPSLLEELKE
ncbi:MAG: hypothetical protein GY822_30560 [Deltaproteobacteria bacterium]|nr:hypothetical protein [Deltaproteobacteria bacterium]